MSRILIVTDAWAPQVNGVVRSLEYTRDELLHLGHEIHIISPDLKRWSTLPLPSYPEIKLEFFAANRLRLAIKDFRPDYIHIATEGPLGWAARRVCNQLALPYSTAFHTNFPDYVAKRLPSFLRSIGAAVTTAFLKRFHQHSYSVMVPAPSIAGQLKQLEIQSVHLWSRGADLTIFKPYGKNLPAYQNLPRPILLYVGRVAVEKNLEEFLQLQTPGSKVVVGDGPDLASLKQSYPAVYFPGTKTGEDLARHYAAADLFVFPSRTETFGLVLLEAMACGLPVATVPAPGPKDIFAHPQPFAVLDDTLQHAVDLLLSQIIDPAAPRDFVINHFSWRQSALQFLSNLCRQPAIRWN